MPDAPPTIDRAARRVAGRLARGLARSWLAANGPGSVPRLILAVLLVGGLAVWWWPARLAAAVALLALCVSAAAERRIGRLLLPHTLALVVLFGADKAQRLLIVAAGRGSGPDPAAALLAGIGNVLPAVQAADCSGGHVAGCRHHPVDGRALSLVPGPVADLIAAAGPVAWLPEA